ncbi:HlyD family type I secretion periplasmic adaptor subunit [Sphingobium sp. H39-3-25]|uniref:HlyD family type I secretion periplasmic adaptor subunit n=1 Tax=Sphingobium arseniciresistens TaxID=3030834 RepID=UPI0023B9A8B4|nr:HlyD family type I secretion periplasmic adaptor subunit [Sphingobium arseniciresistens]
MSSALPMALQPHIEAGAFLDPDGGIAAKRRLTLILSLALFAGVSLAATVVPIGSAVVGSGQLGVESRVKRVAHPLGGTIAQILVSNGQHVRKGQLLIRLDDKVSGTDATLSSLSVDQLLARRARLEAEQMGLGSISFPASLTSRKDPAATKVMADEQRMFAMRRQEQAGMIAQLNARISQYGQQITGYGAQIESLRQQSTLIAPEREGVRQLYEKKLVTINRLNQLERTAADLTGNIGALRAQQAQAQAHISETREQIIQMGQTRRTEAGTELASVNEQLNQQQVRSVSAMDAQHRTMIRAPYDGVVEKMAFVSVGDVIRPAEAIMEIVPDKDRLIVEGAIGPGDVDQVHADQSARIRLSALGATVTPEITGKVVYIAAERVTEPETQRSYFPVRIAIDPSQLSKKDAATLKSGMPAEIFIETGSRTMISYITKPLQDQFARAFRDN